MKTLNKIKPNSIEKPQPREGISIRLKPNLIKFLERESAKRKISFSRLIELMIEVNYDK